MSDHAQTNGNGKLRTALIGAGGIATSHLKALASFDDVDLVALADINEDVMREKAETFDIPRDHCFKDYEQMLDRVKPQAVVVCTPNGLHAPNAIAASQAGAHVQVEKPMAMTAEEAQSMIDAAKSADRKLVIGFQFRFDAKTRFIKRAVEEGRLGEIMFARVNAMRRRGIPNWGVFGRKELQGGGPMIDIGVHALEMTHFMMGSPKPVAATGMTKTYLGNKPSSEVASAWAGWDHETYNVEDIAVGHIRFENGAVIHVQSMFAGHIEKDEWGVQLMGTKGGATWDPPKLFTDDLGHMLNITPAWVQNTGYETYFEQKNRDFVDHVLYDKPTLAPAEHGLMVQQMLDAIYRSSENGGKEVEIK